MENHEAFVEEGMLSLLISLSTVNDAEVRQYAAYAIVKIAQNSDLRKIVTEEGGLEPGELFMHVVTLSPQSYFNSNLPL